LAFAARQSLVLGQFAEKPERSQRSQKLLSMLVIEGAIDAMSKAGQRFRQAQPNEMARPGCQRDIAKAIAD
jgi:hypothetical protein